MGSLNILLEVRVRPYQHLRMHHLLVGIVWASMLAETKSDSGFERDESIDFPGYRGLGTVGPSGLRSRLSTVTQFGNK